MKPAQAWHIADTDLRHYVAGLAPTLAAASIEAHLLACDACRDALSALIATSAGIGTEPSAPDLLWDRIADRIDEPRRSLRFSTRALQVSVASPPLFAATLGVAGALLIALAVATAVNPHWSLPAQLALAPLTPVVGAVVAFQPGIDPAGLLAEATPMAGGRLPFLRALLSSLLSLLSGVLASTLTSIPLSVFGFWLLPGIAFAAVVLATATVVDPTRVAIALAVAWGGMVLWLADRESTVPSVSALHRLVTNGQAFGAGFVAVTAVAVGVCFARRNAVPTWRVA